MKLYKLTPRKNNAQAMVEFAIVLPLLLLLLYGLLEAGRLLFMYSTIVTASRQAARYGSATGEGINPGVLRYQDCAGIRVAANRVDFLNAFDEYDVIIQHDTGPGDPNPIYYCTNVANSEPDPSLALGATDTTFQPAGNTERIVVTIEGDYLPIIPKIVPFLSRTRTNVPPNPIRAISARTIITGVPIEVTPPPGSGGGPGTGGISLSIVANPNSFTGTNQPINYTFTITNGNATGDLTGPFTITGAPFAVDCTAATTPLTPGSSTDCAVVTYLTTQSDVDTGFFEFTATVSGTGPDGNPATDDATSKITYSAPVENPAITLTKTASTSLVTAGDQITYSFTITNSGNVDLTGASVSDPKFGGTIAGCSGDLIVGASLTCTSPVYTVTSTDVQNGSIENTATASATYGTTALTVTDSESVDIYEGSLFLAVTTSPTRLSAPGTITYTYRIKNNSATTLYLQPLNSSFPPLSGNPGTHNCAPNTQLNPGDPTGYTCTSTLTVDNFDSAVACTVNGTAGYCLEHTIKANACTGVGQCNGNRERVSNSVTVRIPVTVNASLAFPSVTVAPTSPAQLIPPAKTFALNHPIVYTYTLQNLGNVTLTLSSPLVTDALVPSVTCDRTSLAPPGSNPSNPASIATCTGPHPISQADLNTGLIPARTASATATWKSETRSATAQVPSVTTFDGPRLSLEIIPNPTTYPAAPGSQPVIYTYRLTNTGTVPLSPSPLYLTSSQQSDGRTLTVSCPNTPLPDPGDFLDCTATDSLSGPPGSTIVNTATATASDGEIFVQATDSATVANPIMTCNATNIFGTAINNPSGMTAAFTNNTGFALKIKDVTVRWNHDAGQNGGDKTLKMQRAQLNGVDFRVWTPSSNWLFVPIATITPTSDTYLQPGASTFTFIFHQTYRNWETGPEPKESVSITFDMPGCEGVTITYTRP